AVAAAALAWRAGVAHWQLRNGRPGCWREWWHDGAVVPPSDGGTGRGLASILVLVAAGTALLPSVAVAATVASGAASADPALRALALLFPADTATPLTRLVSALAALLSGGAAAVMTYTVVTGVNAAAARGESTLTHDAEHFGAAAVIRTAVCVGLLVPALPSGLSAGHAAYSQLAGYASGQASTLWSAFAADVLGVVTDGGGTTTPTGSLGIPSPVGGNALALQALESEACLAYIRHADKTSHDLGGRGSAIPPVSPPSARPTAASGRYLWTWGRCGALVLPAAPAGAPTELSTFRAARMGAVGTLVEAIRTTGLPDQLAAGGMAGSGSAWPDDKLLPALAEAAAAYDGTVRAAAGTYLATRQRGARQASVDAAKTQGWTAAGALWRTLGAASGEAATLAAEAPSRTRPDTDWIGGAMGKEWPNIADRLARQIADESRIPALSGDSLAAPGDESAEIWARLVNPVTRPLTEYLLRQTRSADSDPLADSLSLGHWLVGLSDAGWLTGGVVAVAAGNGISSFAGAKAAFDWFGERMRPYLWWMYGLGIVHSYVLPMIPYISVVFAGINWLISLAEMLVALPLLAMLGANLSGREFVSAALRPGLILVANTVVLPLYTVAALAASYYLLPVGMQIVDKTFSAAFLGSQGGFTLSLGGMLAGLTLALWLKWQVIIRIFGVVHEIPNRLLRYWGSRDEIADGRASAALLGAAFGAAGPASGGGYRGGGGSGRGGGNGGRGGGGGGDDGGGLGIEPVGGGGASKIGATTRGGDAWFQQGGGLAGLSSGQRESAEKSYGEWSKENPSAAARHGLSDYVDYAQERHAARGRGKAE
ncbi:DotA/TraY family protein, partial [Azospirillum isscasi]